MEEKQKEFEKEPKTIEELAKKINVDLNIVRGLVEVLVKQERQKIIDKIFKRMKELRCDYYPTRIRQVEKEFRDEIGDSK